MITKPTAKHQEEARKRVRWKWKSRYKGRQAGWATLLADDGHTQRLYQVRWDDGVIGLVRFDCLIFEAAQTK